MSATLVGRALELDAMAGALLGAAAGAGIVVLIEGEPGIGKTVLLEESCRQAAALGFRCLVGRADELARHRPFGAIVECLGKGRTSAPGLPPVIGEEEHLAEVQGLLSTGGSPPYGVEGGAPAEGEFRIVDAVVDFIEHLSSAGPVVLALEDLQWADPSTLRALNGLAREARRMRLVVVCTLRPMPHSADLQALLETLAGRGTLRLALDGLDPSAMRQLAGELVGGSPGPRLLQQLLRAGGNPFYAAELILSLRRDGALTTEGGVCELHSPDTALPPTLTSMIRGRLGFLSDETIETLQVASILGSSFEVHDLAVATGRSVSGLAPALAGAVRWGILGEDGPRLAFRHDLIREALYQEMPPALRGWLHLAAAQVLTQSGRSPDELAEHVLRGAAPGDTHAVEWLRTAARQAATRSPAVAAELLQRALELAADGDPHRDAATADLACYALRAGRPAEAESICRGLLERDHDAAVDAAVRRCLIQAHLAQGHVEAGFHTVQAALASAPVTEYERARLWSWSSACHAIMWNLAAGEADARLALAATERLQDPVGVGLALGNLAVVAHLRGAFGEALRLARRSLERLGTARCDATQPILPVLNLAATLMDLDAAEASLATLARWQQARRDRGVAWRHPGEECIVAVGAFLSGDWDAAASALGRGLDLAVTTGVRQPALLNSVRALIAVHRGDLATAGSALAAAQGSSSIGGPNWRPDWPMLARALLLEARGQVAEALTAAEAAWDLCRGSGVIAELPFVGPDLVRLALACSRRGLAESVTGELESLAARAGLAFTRGAALRCRGLLGGGSEPALQAVAAYRTSRRRRELGLACEDAAATLTSEGRLAEAAALAGEAVRIFRELGATRDRGRAEARLAPVLARDGESLPARVPARARKIRHGWDSLSQTERRVALLVSEGLTNPDIAAHLGISRRTVQTHVSHALDKLQVGSRVELAVRALAEEPAFTSGSGTVASGA